MCTSNPTGVISMAKPIKKGFLKRHKKGFLWSSWRKEWIVLHEDSSLEWYKDENEDDFIAGLLLKEAPEMIAAGPYANYVPGKPDLPKETDPNCLMVFGNKTKDKTVWFLASNTDELAQWMTAISNTLPPPPQQPPSKGQHPEEQQQKPNPDISSDRPPPYNPDVSAPPYMNAQNTYAGGQPPRAGPGGRGGYGGYGGYGGGGQNTVIIDRRDNGGGDFASGMMMGAALGGWGSGFGWGLGPRFGGWGFGVGFGIGPPIGYGYNNTDINITNNYDVNNTTTNNDTSGADNNNANPTEPDPAPNPDPPTDVDNSIDPGLDTGVDPNGFQPGFEPDAEMYPDSGIDPGLMDGGGLGMERMEYPEGGTGFDMGAGQFDMGGGGFDMGGGGFDMGGGGFDMGGGEFDMGGGMFDMGGGGFDMGGFDGGGFDL